jgi:hypothetical protein
MDKYRWVLREHPMKFKVEDYVVVKANLRTYDPGSYGQVIDLSPSRGYVLLNILPGSSTYRRNTQNTGLMTWYDEEDLLPATKEEYEASLVIEG